MARLGKADSRDAAADTDGDGTEDGTGRAVRPPRPRPEWMRPAALAQRIIGLAGLAVILWAVAYAILPFSVTPATPATTPAAQRTSVTCDPPVVQVFNRGPKVTLPNGQVLQPAPPCTLQADHRLYVAVPVVVLVFIAVAGLRRVLLD